MEVRRGGHLQFFLRKAAFRTNDDCYGTLIQERRGWSSALVRQPPAATLRLLYEAGQCHRVLHRRSPGGAALLDRLDRRSLETSDVGVLEAGCYACCTLTLQRNDPGHPQLDRLFYHPGKPIPIAGGHTEGQRRWRLLHFDCIDIYHPFLSGLDQIPASPQPHTIKDLN